jgi:arylsulfatase A-like enzyme
MFTGTHPGTHMYLGWGPDGENHVIRPDIVTIPEFLTEHLYKCSGTAAHTRILPEFGFGRNMHRFEINNMSAKDFITRETDSRKQVETLIKWIDIDLNDGSNRLFYFGHFFDPHGPYIPPLPISGEELHIQKIKNFSEGTRNQYLERYAARADPIKPEYDYIKDLYSQSVRHTATQLARLIEHIKKVGLFENALIIVTGDHGEEFGERGFYGHRSLYDANIRPFIAIKPPQGIEWPDDIRTVDHIDFLPTIAELIDTPPPESVQGRPIQDQRRSDLPRITERIRPGPYNVSVEVDGKKAIFTFEGNWPFRPDVAKVADGPILSEFYDVSKVRDGDYSDIGDILTVHEKNEFVSIAESFIDSDNHAIAHYTDLDITEETDALLEDLGYK